VLWQVPERPFHWIVAVLLLAIDVWMVALGPTLTVHTCLAPYVDFAVGRR